MCSCRIIVSQKERYSSQSCFQDCIACASLHETFNSVGLHHVSCMSGKGRTVPVRAMSGDIAPLIPNISSRWKGVFKFKLQPLYYRVGPRVGMDVLGMSLPHSVIRQNMPPTQIRLLIQADSSHAPLQELPLNCCTSYRPIHKR